jgi:ORF6N domain
VLDSDLAAVYGVTTKRLNEQLRRNRRRFPEDFAFQLTAEEFEALRSQFATLEEDPRKGAGSKRSQNATTSSSSLAMWSQIATTSRKRRRKTHRPWAFTEHGALQLANILRSDRAIAMSVYVIRAFIELRERVASNAAILKRLAEIDKTLLEHDTALRDIYQKLLPLLAPPPEPARPQIGFSP